MTVTFALSSFNTHTYAWHENLGIDPNKAAELYKTSPNDPAIVQWKSALQSAINDMDKCFDPLSAIICESMMSTIISNCERHPNELLACNDARIAQYPLILKKAQEAAQEALKGGIPSRLPEYAASVIEKCFSNPNSNTTFAVASSSCDTELLSLQRDCQMASSPYDYCKDERFIGYLKQHNILILNTTKIP